MCYGDSVLSGSNYKSITGIYYDTLPSIFGCDSVVVTDLTVLDSIPVLLDTLEICAGDSANIGGSYFDTAGTYYETYTTAQGCDSVVEISLEIIPITTDTIPTTICSGDSIQVNGIYYGQEGYYVDTLSSTIGCDSVVIINLTVDTIAPSFDTLEICNGDSAWIGGIYVYSVGNYNDTLVNSAGCDSVVQVSVVVNDVYTNFDTLSICANDSANINGSYYFVTGLYTDTLASLSGCDSIVYTTLFVDPIFEFTDTVNICAGDSIQLGNNYYHNSGLYTDSLVTTLGCDSIISTLVIVDSASSLTDSMTICAGDSIFFAGAYVSTTGQYVDSLQNSVGCDSLIYFNLTVEPIIVTQDTIDICAGDSVFVGGGYQFTTGLYEDTLTAQGGCDSIIVLSLIHI